MQVNNMKVKFIEEEQKLDIVSPILQAVYSNDHIILTPEKGRKQINCTKSKHIPGSHNNVMQTHVN